MATFTDLVFVSNGDLQAVAAEVTSALSVSFEWHHSCYRGGDYLLSPRGYGEEEKTSVQRNAEMDELAEPDYPDALTVVHVDGTRRPEEIEHQLSQSSLTLIRRSTWDEHDRDSEQDSKSRALTPERPAIVRLFHAMARRWGRRDH